MWIKTLLSVTKPLRYRIDGYTFSKGPHEGYLKEIRGAVEGKPLLIVGNGPSLNNTPLDSFCNCFSIGMNKIDLIFDKTKWRPDLVLVTNNLVVRQHWDKMLENNIAYYLSWKSRFFIPLSKRKSFRFFLNNVTDYFQSDISTGVGVSGTVTYTALQFAFYLKADPVIIVGVDHNFSHDGAANEYEKRNSDDHNHFDPNYFAKGQYWGVPNLPQSEAGFEKAKSAFEEDGRRVLDATVGGKLQVFDKISISEAIEILNGNESF